MLTALGPEIWIAEGGAVTGAAGFHFPTRMIVIRLKDGSIILWSPIDPDETLIGEVAALGPVAAIVGPNSLHHTYLSEWTEAFPKAKLIAAPRLPDARPDLSFDTVLAQTSPPEWAGQLDHVILANRITDEVVLFHRESGTVIFTDVIQQMPRNWYSGWRAVVARLDLMTATAPTVPRKFRMGFKDRKGLREHLAIIQGWPAERLVMAHGPVVTHRAAEVLAAAFSWLRA